MSVVSNELNYSDFDIFKINIGSDTFIFDDEQIFLECLNSIEVSDFFRLRSNFINSVLSPSPLSVAITSSLGVSSPSVLSSRG